jgi:mono/diheme cytochrome c family protein
MTRPSVHWLTAFALATATLACAPTHEEPAAAAGDPYLHDASFRRATLVASLVRTGNEYSRVRLASYDTGDANDWSRLAEWNPRVEPLPLGELDRPGGARAGAPLGPAARALSLSDAALRGDEAALLALGEEAFFRYPVQLAQEAELATTSRDAFAQYGFWSDDARGAGGLVRVELPDGTPTFAYTCATCHGARREGRLVLGVPNDRLDLGRLTFDAATRGGPVDPTLGALWRSWGPGRLDVTTAFGGEPVRIADLRPVRWLSHLHADATVAQKDRATLAVRIETLLVTVHSATNRPPRAVALGLAAYVWSLADTLPAPPAEAPRGAAVFAENCARCHVPPAFTGPPVPLDVVGTDPTIGLSAVRGTGTYRVPSLHGVSTRGPLLHDASLPDLAHMFDPARLTDDFDGGRHGPGAVRGHVFGLALSDAERAALLAYLATL